MKRFLTENFAAREARLEHDKLVRTNEEQIRILMDNVLLAITMNALMLSVQTSNTRPYRKIHSTTRQLAKKNLCIQRLLQRLMKLLQTIYLQKCVLHRVVHLLTIPFLKFADWKHSTLVTILSGMIKPKKFGVKIKTLTRDKLHGISDQLCDHLKARFAADQQKLWSVFDSAALKNWTYDFGVTEIKKLSIKYKDLNGILNDDLTIKQYNDFKFLMSEKLKSDTIASLPEIATSLQMMNSLTYFKR